jgi:predicted DNA-binding transcriptional regulator YafY
MREIAQELSPVSRVLLALEAIQNRPGITAGELGRRLGVTERAARRHVALLREAGIPIESSRGPYGGYRAGRGLRLAPLMFTPAEALGLAMAVVEGHREAADPAELVGGALAKIIRVLPDRVAEPVREALREHRPAAATPHEPWADPELTVKLLESCVCARRIRVLYRSPSAAEPRAMELDPWAVVLRHSRWYLLCWSHHRQARRVLRVDRIVSVETRPETFSPPGHLDALRTLEEQFSQGWRYPVDVVIDAPVDEVAGWLPRSLGRLEPHQASDEPGAAADRERTRLLASTDEPDWYARHLAAIPAPFQVRGSEPVRAAVAALARKLAGAAETD